MDREFVAVCKGVALGLLAIGLVIIIVTCGAVQ